MINVTERAKRELKRLLSQKVDWPEARLRLMDRGQGILGLGIDIELPGDQIVEYKILSVPFPVPLFAHRIIRQEISRPLTQDLVLSTNPCS